MKRIRTILLTLVLSVSMLAPEFSMLPAAYAQDAAPAVEQSADAAGAAGAEADALAAESGGEAASEAEPAAEPQGADAEPAVDAAEADGAEDGETTDPESPEPGDTDDQDWQAPGSYDVIPMVELDDHGMLVLPEGTPETVSTSHSEYGECVLVKGTVADFNALRVKVGDEFDFTEGGAGRLTLDALKDKDAGMSVKLQVYLDDEAEPVGEVALKKQMGKREWANDGSLDFSLGEKEITGKHSVSLGFKIEGKKDTAKTTVALRSLQFCKTTVPVMYFHIDESEGTIAAMNSSEDHSVECYGSVDLVVPDAFNADDTFRDEYSEQSSQYGMQLEYIRGRGNSTWDNDKKPYKVKFDKGQDLFGFGKNKHWVLLANRYDNSLVRNRMTYWLGQQLGMEYTPQCVPVEVVMNGEFYGSYLLCEQIRVGEGRVTIDDLDDIKDVPAVTDETIKTGGYLLSMDFEDDDKRQISTDSGMQLFIESPDDNVAYFSDYIKAYVQKVENAIFGKDFKDEDGHPYTDYLDLGAAVDYWWIQEFSANGDAYGNGSTYLYKKRDSETGAGKLYWGPLWDFDYVAWGDLDYGADAPEDLDCTGNPWFSAMRTDPAFIEAVKARYEEEGGIRDKIVEITKEGGRLDKYLAQMETSYEYDHAKWGAYDSRIDEYNGEIEQLRTWIEDRTEKVDEAIKDFKTESHTVKFMIDGEIVKEVTVMGFLRERDFPEVPEKEGYRFEGWADEEEFEIYEDGSRVTRDITISAMYISEDELVYPEKIFFKQYDVYVTPEQGGYGSDDLGWYFPEARVMPDEAVDTELTWTISDESVAAIEEDSDYIVIKGLGDAVVTASTANGVSASFNLHVVTEDDMEYSEGMSIDKTSMTLKEGEYDQIIATPDAVPSMYPEVIWVSSDENVAYVDEIGVVRANSAGKAEIMMINIETRQILRCQVTVRPESNEGLTVQHKGSTYRITSDEEGNRTAMLIKAKNAKTVTIPATVSLYGEKYNVTAIKAKAFAKSKATKLIVKTKKLKKATVKKSLKKSKVTKIKVKVGKKKVNKKFVKKYKKIFTKKNAGKGVKVW